MHLLSIKNITVRKNALWYGNSLLVAKRLRRNLERKWRKSKSELDLTAYKTQCMHVNND